MALTQNVIQYLLLLIFDSMHKKIKLIYKSFCTIN